MLSSNQAHVLTELRRRGGVVENLFQFGVRELGFDYSHIHQIVSRLEEKAFVRVSRPAQRPLIIQIEENA